MRASVSNIQRHWMTSKVVHHLPGRLRLYVPALEKLSFEWSRYTSDLIRIIKLKEGIDDVELCIATGRVLVWYNPDLTHQGEILSWLKQLTLWLYSDYADEPFFSKRQVVPFLKKMHARVSRTLYFDRHGSEVA